MITEASEEETRFKATAWALGWTKATAALLPILKVPQLAIICWVAWFTVILAPAWLMLPDPEVMLPSVGRALGSRA